MKTHEAIIFALAPIILAFGALHSYTTISRDMPQLMPSGPYPGDSVIPDAVRVTQHMALSLEFRRSPEGRWRVRCRGDLSLSDCLYFVRCSLTFP